jgi:hypothetical protein
MQFIILFASLIAATIALPIAQAGGTDVLSEATSGTDSSLPGNDFLGDGSLPATDLLTADNELMGRSPEVGVSTLQPTGKGFVDSPHRLALAISYQEPRVAPIVWWRVVPTMRSTAVETLHQIWRALPATSWAAHQKLKLGQVDLIAVDIRFSEQHLTDNQQAGTGDALSGTAGGTNSLMTGGANNALNSAGNSASDVSSSGGKLVNRAPRPQVGVSHFKLVLASHKWLFLTMDQ